MSDPSISVQDGVVVLFTFSRTSRFGSEIEVCQKRKKWT